MPAFNYTALNAKGREIKGTIEADTHRHVRQMLREQGLTPLTITTIQKPQQWQQSWLKRRTFAMNRNDLALFTRQLATLLAAGMPLEEALRAVAEQTEKAKVKSVILAVRSRVMEGHSLKRALSDFPQAFNTLYCATIASGESAGHLDQILERLADYIENQQAMRQKITQALIYPSIMTLVSMLIVIFLLSFVVPKMIDVFTSSQQELPWVTTVLMGISQWFKRYAIALLIAIVIMGIGLNLLMKRYPAVKKNLHQWLLKLPLLGKTTKVINTARYSRTVGILSNAGVPILEAMATAAELVTNIPIHQALTQATVKVREGAAIHLALKNTGYFPPMSIHLIGSGEKSGQLEAMLERAANNQDKEVTRLIDTLLTLFEPFLILTMGAVVLFIVLAILLPIFALNQFAM